MGWYVICVSSFFTQGVHFNTSYEALKTEIATVLKVFAHGVESFVGDTENENLRLSTALSCAGLGERAKWAIGDRFYRYLRNVSIDLDSSPGKPPLEFNQEGTLKSVELQIMNLRPGPTDRLLVWEQVSFLFWCFIFRLFQLSLSLSSG